MTKTIIAALILAAAGAARAEDPQFGACWQNGTCVGPRVAAPAMSVDMKTGEAQFGVLPGFGYGIEFTSHKIPWGIAAFVNVQESSLMSGDDSGTTKKKAVPSLMFDFFRYVHLGVMYPPGGHAFGLITLGSDLGSAPSPVAK